MTVHSVSLSSLCGEMLEPLGICTYVCDYIYIYLYLHPCFLKGEGALQSVVGRCSPSSSLTSSSWELSGTSAIERSREMRRARGEITCEARPGFISCSARKVTFAGLIDLGLLQISSAQQAAGGNYWQCLQVTVIKPQVIIILFHF